MTYPAVSHLLRPTLALVVALSCQPGLVAQEAEKEKESSPPPPALGKAATEALKARYQTAEHWVQKAVILLSLNHYWHPVGSDIILAAVRDKDLRLRAFGIEALLRAEDGLLPNVVSPELLEELISKQLNQRNSHYRERLLGALVRIAPKAGATKKSEWRKWWRGAKATWQPGKWQPKEKADDNKGGTVVGVADRAFDLYSAGLELVICIDSTGSMQPTIDAVADALGQMVDILDGISPKFRLGVVHYKDRDDFGRIGAKVIVPLAKNVGAARKRLVRLRAVGGGDLPEAVDGGLELALGPKMKWNIEANKVVILIGDAPPHAANASKCVDLARAAHEDPQSLSKRPTTGAKAKVKPRPFITSAIGVVLNLVGFDDDPNYDRFINSQKRMKRDFADIAKAGGGVFVKLEFTMKKGRPSRAERKKAKKEGRGKARAATATQKIVEHILVLSFGSKFAREMRAFVRIFYAYKGAGLFK
ncbi:MAG: vWA domain-containing protein [Planctomycetota bacterium]|jgi:hypothetical protein